MRFYNENNLYSFFFISSSALCKEKIIANVQANDFSMVEQTIINDNFNLTLHKLFGMQYKIITSETIYEELKKLNLNIEECSQECNLNLANFLKAKFSFILKVRKANRKYYILIELYNIKENALIDGFEGSFKSNKQDRIKFLSKVIEKNISKFKSKLLGVYKHLVNKKVSNKETKKSQTTLSDLKKYYLGNSSKSYVKSKSLKEEHFNVLLRNNIIYSLIIVAGITFTFGGLSIINKAKEEINNQKRGEIKRGVGITFLSLGIVTIFTGGLFSLGCNAFLKDVYEKAYYVNRNQIKACLLNTDKMNSKFKRFKDNIEFKISASQKRFQGFVSFRF